MKKHFLPTIVVLFLIFSLSCPVNADELYEDSEEESAETFSFDDESLLDGPLGDIASGETTGQIKKLTGINAKYAVVIEKNSGRIIYGKNPLNKSPMASTTKIMTCILALENGDLESQVEVSKKASQIGGSQIRLIQGQKVKLEELLYGLMLNSGNDAAIAVAEHIGGSVEGFVEMMNKKAADIGAENTRFENPHGLDSSGHYTTAYDLAMIARYALSNSKFAEIVSTKKISTTIGEFRNTNEMLFAYAGANGVKTGFTGQAGRCLVTSASKNGLDLIAVVINSPTRKDRANSSKKMLDWCFSNFLNVTLTRESDMIGVINVVRGKNAKVDVVIKDTVIMPLSVDEKLSLRYENNIQKELNAPVDVGQVVGQTKIYAGDVLLSTVDIITAGRSPEMEFSDYFSNALKLFIDIFVRNKF